MNNILKFVILLLLISISSFALRNDKNNDETPKKPTYSQFKTPVKYEFYALYNAYRTEMNLDTLVEDTVLVVA